MEQKPDFDYPEYGIGESRKTDNCSHCGVELPVERLKKDLDGFPLCQFCLDMYGE